MPLAFAMAQGQRESSILNAQGDKESAILRAQGEQESIKLVLSATGDSEENKRTVVGYLLGQSYIKVLPNMAKNGERVFVPYESSALLGSDSVQIRSEPDSEGSGFFVSKVTK